MDSGFLAPGETLDDQYDITKELLPEEVIWIMDQLLCHEVSCAAKTGEEAQANEGLLQQ